MRWNALYIIYLARFDRPEELRHGHKIHGRGKAEGNVKGFVPTCTRPQKRSFSKTAVFLLRNTPVSSAAVSTWPTSDGRVFRFRHLQNLICGYILKLLDLPRRPADFDLFGAIVRSETKMNRPVA